jgi:hypothetical protein
VREISKKEGEKHFKGGGGGRGENVKGFCAKVAGFALAAPAFVEVV